MRKTFLAFICLAVSAAAQVTPNIGLNLPAFNAPNWNTPVNNNFSTLDSYLSGGLAIPALKINGTLQVGGQIIFNSIGNGCLNISSGIVGSAGCGSVNVNNVPVGTPNFQNGTAGNVINFIQTGSNIQATVQPLSITSNLLANIVSAGTCSYSTVNFNAKGQITSCTSGTVPVTSFNLRTGGITPQLADYQALLLTNATLTAPLKVTDSAGNTIKGAAGSMLIGDSTSQAGLVGNLFEMILPGGTWLFGATSVTPPSGAATGTGQMVLATNPVLPSYVDVTGIAVPGNPASGNFRLYFNSTSGLLGCLSAGGANCLPLATFASLSSGTSTATFTMGSGGQITYAGTGIVNANYLGGLALPPFSPGNICFAGGVLSICPAGSGTVTSAVVAGTSGQIVATGTCTITTTGTCTLSLPTTVSLTNITIGGNLNLYGMNFPASAPGSLSCLQNTGAAFQWGSCATGAGTVTATSATPGTLGSGSSAFATIAVSNGTTTPNFTFALANAGAFTLWGNNTSGSGTPGYLYTVGAGANNIPQLTGSSLLPTGIIPVFTINNSTSLAASGANFLTSTVNAAGYTITPSTPSGNGVKFELSGTGNNSLAVGGITILGTPSVGYVPLATSSSAATWQAFSGVSGLTTHEAVLSSSATVVASTPAEFFASSYLPASGGDYCALLNGIWTTMPAGSTVVWDIPGKLACNSNPWAGITPSAYIPGTLKLKVPVAFFTTAGWVKPPKVNVIGTGEAKSNEDGTQGTAIVACPSSSISPCTGSFPLDTPVYAVVSNLPNFSYSGAGTTTRDENLTFDCNYVQGARGYMNYATQENGGATNINPRNCGNNGIDFDLGNFQGAGSSGDTDNSRFDGINAGNGTQMGGVTAACTYGSIVMRMNYPAGAPGPKSIANITANSLGCTTLSPSIFLDHSMEINGAATDFPGKIHTEDTGRSAVCFGCKTLLGTASMTSGSPTTTVFYSSGDDWSAGCSGTIIIENVRYPIASCASPASLVVTGSPSTSSTARYSLETHVGATNEHLPVADHCCSANFTGTASGTTFTVSAGAVPQSNWTGSVLLGSNSYTIASTTSSTIVTTTTITGSPTSGTFGSIYEIDGSSSTQAITLTNFKALTPNKPSMMMIDGFNSIIPTITDSNIVCYAIDTNDLVVCDDSGVNAVHLNGGAVVGGTGSSEMATGTSSNTDLAGTLTMTSGTKTYTFVNTYTSHPICTASDATSIAPVQVTYTGSTAVIFTTTGASDNISYICVGRN